MLQLIVPPTNDPCGAERLIKAAKAALNACAVGAKADFKVTTRTWEHQPVFTIDKSDNERRIVGTDDKIYGYVNHGTKPHLIMPRGGGFLTWMGANYRAKTTPGMLRSVKGGNDNTIVWARKVQHPGNEARNFDKVIVEKWSKEMPLKVQQALSDAADYNSKPVSEWDWGHEA